jgi:hypothetical protein
VRRELISSEQSHKWDGEGEQALVERFEGSFTTERISDEHNCKINHLIGTETPTGKTDSLDHLLQQTVTGQVVCHDRDFSEPLRG